MNIFKQNNPSENSVEELATDEEEEKRLIELTTGRVATYVKEFIEFTMKVTGIDFRICHTKTSFEGSLYINYMPSIPMLVTRLKYGEAWWAFTISKPVVLFRVLVVNISTLIVGVSFFLLYKHDRLVRDLEVSILDYDSRQSECVTIRDFEPIHVKKVEDLMKLKGQIRSLGIALTNLSGQGVINLGTVGLLPLAFFFMAQILIRKKSICCDMLSFLFWPMAERERIIGDIHILIKDLLTSIKNRKFLRFKPKTQKELLELSSLRQRQDDVLFLQLLLDIDTLRWVQPFSVSSKWYQKLTKRLRFMLIMSIFCAAVIPALSSISLVTLDMLAGIGLSHELAKCIQWNEDAFILKNLNNFDKFSREEQEAYAEYGGSFSSRISFLLHIETRHYYTLNRCGFLLSYLTLLISIFFWGTFYVNTFIFASMDKVVWSNQLDNQLQECIKLAKEMDHTNSEYSDQDYQLLIKQLTVAYLNFELFRRQHRRYIPLAKFFLGQGSIIAFGGLLLFYFIGTSIETKGLSSVIYTCAAIASVINIYLLAASVVSRKIERIMKNVAYLLAHLRNTRMLHSYPVELWRRQALTDKETTNFYALHILGRSLSYKDLLSFNLHVFMLVLILMKINHKYTTNNGTSNG